MSGAVFTRAERINRFIYNGLFKRNSMFLSGVFVSAFAFELGFDRAVDKLWDSWNKDLLWKNVKHRFVE